MRKLSSLVQQYGCGVWHFKAVLNQPVFRVTVCTAAWLLLNLPGASAQQEVASAWLPPNPAELRPRAEAGDTLAQIALAEYYVLYAEPPNADSAFFYAQQAHRKGSAGGSYLLGISYLNGLGVSKDPKQGVKHLETAGERGHPEAWPALMEEFSRPQSDFSGQGLALDTTRAVRYARRAYADHQHAEASFFLAECYLRGAGVRPDTARALRYLEFVADTLKLPFGQLKMANLHFNCPYSFAMHLPKAAHYYTLASQNPLSTPEEANAGEVGLYALAKFRRRIYTLQLLLAPPDPETAPRLLIR